MPKQGNVRLLLTLFGVLMLAITSFGPHVGSQRDHVGSLSATSVTPRGTASYTRASAAVVSRSEVNTDQVPRISPAEHPYAPADTPFHSTADTPFHSNVNQHRYAAIKATAAHNP